MVLDLLLVNGEPRFRPVDVAPSEPLDLTREAEAAVPRQREDEPPVVVGARRDDRLDGLRGHIDDPVVVHLRAAWHLGERVHRDEPVADGGLEKLPRPSQVHRRRRGGVAVEEPPLVSVDIALGDRFEGPILAENLLEEPSRPGVVSSRGWLLLAEAAEQLIEVLAERDNLRRGMLPRWHEPGPGEPTMDLVAQATDPFRRLATLDSVGHAPAIYRKNVALTRRRNRWARP